MIRNFPAFSKLEIDHKDEITRFTSGFPPYSDFNFTSLLSWDDGSTEISLINGNLAIKLADYITGESAYSLLGDNQIEESAKLLLTLTDKLSFVPETAARNITDQSTFWIEEDRNNFDYIYEVGMLADLPGGDLKKKRNKANRFRNSLDGMEVASRQLSPSDRQDVERIFAAWHDSADKTEEEIRAERQALSRLVEYSGSLDIEMTSISIGGSLMAFSLNEKIGPQYSICHFEKALPEHNDLNVYTYLSQQAAKRLRELGCQYVNWEQDLGLPGLRSAKLSYKPDRFLKKYIVGLR